MLRAHWQFLLQGCHAPSPIPSQASRFNCGCCKLVGDFLPKATAIRFSTASVASSLRSSLDASAKSREAGFTSFRAGWDASLLQPVLGSIWYDMVNMVDHGMAWCAASGESHERLGELAHRVALPTSTFSIHSTCRCRATGQKLSYTIR